MLYDIVFNDLEFLLPLQLQQPFKSVMLGERIIATAGIDRAISLYPLESWELIVHELHRLPSLNPHVRKLQRTILGYAIEIQQTKTSTVALSAPLKRYAGIRKKASALLFPNKIEIWNPHTLTYQLEKSNDLTHRQVAGILRGADDESDSEMLEYICPKAVVTIPVLR